MQMITNLIINNYKSISHLELDCARINVLIGEPNVGKSNILEALDLSYLSWMLAGNETNEKYEKEKVDIKNFFRVDKVSDLFNMGDVSKTISIVHPGFSNGTELKFNRENDFDAKNKHENENNLFEWSQGHAGRTLFDNDFVPAKNAQYYSSPIKPYRYKDNIEFHDIGNYIDRLMPPFGNNLLEVIKHDKTFGAFIGELIQDFELEMNADISTQKLLIQKRINPGLVYSLPYKALSDTLKRVIFYSAVIRHNNATVITLEEPDTHSFPKFVSFLSDEIIENNQNQFFIATHNPYLLNNLIENTPAAELAVFVCGFDKSRGTYANKLTSEDISELLDYGVDIFFNINRYLHDIVDHNS